MTDQATKRNIILNAFGESFWGVTLQFIASATVLTVLLKQFDATAMEVSLVFAIEFGLARLPQIVGGFVFTSMANRKWRLLAWYAFVSVPFIFLMGTVALFADQLTPVQVRMGLLLSFAGFWCTIGVTMAAWQDWIGHLFDISVRGRAVGIGTGIHAIFGMAAALIAGWMINNLSSPQVFAYLFYAAGTTSVVGLVPWLLVHDSAAGRHDAFPKQNVADFIACVRQTLANRSVLTLMVGVMLLEYGLSFAPFIAVYFRSPYGGSLSAGTIVSCGVAWQIGLALASPVAGMMGDRYGHRLNLIIASLVLAGAPLVLLSVQGLAGCVGTYWLIGLASGFVYLGMWNLNLESCPHDNRLAHVTSFNIAAALGLLPIPYLAGRIVDDLGIQWLFVVTAMCSGLAGLWLISVFRDPRSRRVEVEPMEERSNG